MKRTLVVCLVIVVLAVAIACIPRPVPVRAGKAALIVHHGRTYEVRDPGKRTYMPLVTVMDYSYWWVDKTHQPGPIRFRLNGQAIGVDIPPFKVVDRAPLEYYPTNLDVQGVIQSTVRLAIGRLAKLHTPSGKDFGQLVTADVANKLAEIGLAPANRGSRIIIRGPRSGDLNVDLLAH